MPKAANKTRKEKICEYNSKLQLKQRCSFSLLVTADFEVLAPLQIRNNAEQSEPRAQNDNVKKAKTTYNLP